MASKYRQKYQLPEGFYNVIEDYSREVLRDQPQDILEFSYMYFKAMEEVSAKLMLDIFRVSIRTDLTVIKGNLEDFNYPNKGKNIPPPRMDDGMMDEQMMQDGQYEGD